MRRAIIEGIVGGLAIAFMLSVGKLDLVRAAKERPAKVAAAEPARPVEARRPCP